MRSASLAFLRIYHIFTRYGMDSEKLRTILFDYVHVINAFGITPTLPITATVVERHPGLFQRLQDETMVEFAIHGFRHIDYSELNQSQFEEHLYNAIDIFHKHHLRFFGHRFPFLCKDNEKIQLLKSSGFQWDSSDCIAWHSPLFEGVSKQRADAYEQILKSYQISDSYNSVAVPRRKNGMLEIPLSLPDDDILVDRLGLSLTRFAGVFQEMLNQVQARGELLIFQLHPERFPWFKKPLLQVLNSIKNEKGIWKTSMNEIAVWWREKMDFQCSVEGIQKDRYRISVRCSDRAAVLIKNSMGTERSKPFWRSWNSIPGKRWEIFSPRKPVIGVHPDLSETVTPLLINEGFVFEISSPSDNYSVYLETKTINVDENVERQIADAVDNTPYPLIRFWRWPEEKQCAVALSGDVDAIDIWDYFARYYG